MNTTNLEKAVNWFFNGGYVKCSTVKGSSKFNKITGAFTAINKLSALLNLKHSEAILLLYEGKVNGKKIKK